jgi:hypothetical protein
MGGTGGGGVVVRDDNDSDVDVSLAAVHSEDGLAPRRGSGRYAALFGEGPVPTAYEQRFQTARASTPAVRRSVTGDHLDRHDGSSAQVGGVLGIMADGRPLADSRSTSQTVSDADWLGVGGAPLPPHPRVLSDSGVTPSDRSVQRLPSGGDGVAAEAGSSDAWAERDLAILVEHGAERVELHLPARAVACDAVRAACDHYSHFDDQAYVLWALEQQRAVEDSELVRALANADGRVHLRLLTRVQVAAAATGPTVRPTASAASQAGGLASPLPRTPRGPLPSSNSSLQVRPGPLPRGRYRDVPTCRQDRESSTRTHTQRERDGWRRA